MTQTKKIKVTALHRKHPYRINLEASRETVADKIKNSSHTYSVVLLTGVALITSMLILPPASHLKPPVVVEPTGSASFSMVDILNGTGGPEVVPTREVSALEQIELKFDEPPSQFDILLVDLFTEEVEGPVVAVTKVYNHLKVANTVMPTTSPEITSDYGWRTPPCRGCSADHKGVDFVPGYGEPIFAVADGMVTEMGSNGGYGYYVKLQHLIANTEGVMEEWETLYAHMRKDSFPENMIVGSAVKAGETIGEVGNTGMSTGPHLHFELLINGEHVDPLPLLGNYEVIIVSEEDYPDFMFVGETFKKIETVVTYE